LLMESGIAGASGGAVIAARVGKIAVREILNFIPIVGWAIKGVVGGSLTASIDWAFLLFCETRFGS
jgi:uncharacterized protein (DUF697 family)